MYELLNSILVLKDLNCYFDPESLVLFAGSKVLSVQENVKKYLSQRKMNFLQKPCFYDDPQLFSSFSLKLHVTEKCNLRCSYCYLSEVKHSVNYRNMSKSSIEKAFRFVLKAYPAIKKIRINLFGGEPLLFDNINFVIKKAEEVFAEQERYIVFVTNGTYLPEDVFEVLQKQNVYFSLSLDGDKQTHDLLRKDVLGKGSYDLIEKNIPRFKLLILILWQGQPLLLLI